MESASRGSQLLLLPVHIYRERLKAQVLRNAAVSGPEECWPWLGHRWTNGYGQTRMYGRITPAHRASYFAFVGEIATGMDICHRCDNRACINPQHLFAASHLENIRDMIRKGRRVQGKANPRRGELNAASIPVSIEGQVFASRGDAARSFGTSKRNIQHWIRAGKAVSLTRDN